MSHRTPWGIQRHSFGRLWKLLAVKRREPKRPARRQRLKLHLEPLEMRTVPSSTDGGAAAPVAHNDSIDTDAGNAVLVNVLANDTDANGTIAVNTVAVSTTPGHGTATPDASGHINYLPADGFFGTDTFTYTFRDVGGSLSNAAAVTVVVNRPTASDDFTHTLGTMPVTIDVLANDTDPDGPDKLNPASVAVTGGPAHGTLQPPDSGSGAITYTPANGFVGTDTFHYTVTDFPGATSNVATVTVTVDRSAGINNDSIDTDAGNPVTISVLANDSDPSGLNAGSVVVAQTPGHGSAVVQSSGAILYTPANGFAGTDTFAYTVQNNNGIILGPAVVTIVVNRPTANDDFAQTSTGTPVTLDVLGNDSDPDGPNKIDPTTLAITSSPAHGTATLVNGQVSYSPAAGFAGTDTLHYTVTDFAGATSNVATVTITVNGVGIVNTDSIDTDAGNPVSISVLANDSDPSGLNAGSVAVVQTPGHGSAAVQASGTIVYTPANGFAGTDTFTYTVQNTNGTTLGPASVTIVVNRPTANDDFVNTIGGDAVTINLLANDTDPDGPNKIDASTLALVGNPGHGTAVIADGKISYTPAPGFIGTDGFTYHVADFAGAVSNVATVTVTIDRSQGINDDSIDTDEGNPVTIDVLANDTDPNGLQAGTVTVAQTPGHGSATANAQGMITYTPAAGFFGTDTFSYTARNGNGVTVGPATVSVVVNRPTANDDFTRTIGTDPVAIDVLANDTDPDGADKIDPSTVTVTTNPGHGGVSVNAGQIIYTPNSGFVGTDTFQYTVKDLPGATSNAATVSIIVDFGQIHGTIFADYNADAIPGPGEAGLAGHTLFLDLNSNGQIDPHEPTATTDATGQYSFAGLAAGNYTVLEDLSATPNAEPTSSQGTAHTVTLTDQSPVVSGKDIGNLIVSSAAPLPVVAVIFPTNFSHDPNVVFVEGVYHNVLGHDADAGGLSFWLSQLNQPGGSPAAVAQAIWESLEHRTEEVASYYRTFFQRNPDASGENFWVQTFLSGASETTVVLGFVTSPEFQNAHAGNDSFLTGLYTGVLGHDADAGGFAYWSNQLATQQASRAQVALGFLDSPEALRQAVDGYYAAFFHRPADGGEAFWVSQLHGGQSLEAVGIGFLASPEYLRGAFAASH